MDDNSFENKRLSRRELIRRAGLSGLTVAAAATLVSQSPIAYGASSQDDSPEGFLAYAYGQRTRAMTTGNTTLLDPLYDPSSSALLSFEKDRARFFNAGLLAIWDNSKLIDYVSTMTLANLKLSGSVAVVQIHEQISMRWIPRPMPESPERREARMRYPKSYEQIISVGPQGEITSSIGTSHDVTLQKSLTGWRIVKDAYEESLLYGVSPDLSPVVETRTGGPVTTDIPPAPALAGPAAPSTCIIFQPGAAVNYAMAHCGGGAYNPNF